MVDLDIRVSVVALLTLLQVKSVVLVGLIRGASNDSIKDRGVVLDSRAKIRP